jgi:hypothetical protein
MSVGAVVACIALLGGALFAGAADAKKKKGKGKGKGGVCRTVTAEATGAAIPDRPSPGPTFFGVLNTPVNVNSRPCSGATVAKVDVTFQTTGATAQAASDLFFRLQSPDGLTYDVSGNGFNGQNIGPVTMTSHTRIQTCATFPPPAAPPPPPCTDPDFALNPPYQGAARDSDLPLFRGVPVNGTWTWSAYDDGAVDTSILNFVRLVITPNPTSKPRSKKKKKK